MLPWKLRKCQILPVNQNLSSIYFPLAKFQLVSCNPSLAIIWQMTYSETAKTVFSHLKRKHCALSTCALGFEENARFLRLNETESKQRLWYKKVYICERINQKTKDYLNVRVQLYNTKISHIFARFGKDHCITIPVSIQGWLNCLLTTCTKLILC